MYTPILIAALFTIVGTWKQPKCPSKDEWIEKMWYIYIYIYIYNRAQFSHDYLLDDLLVCPEKYFLTFLPDAVLGSLHK